MNLTSLTSRGRWITLLCGLGIVFAAGLAIGTIWWTTMVLPDLQISKRLASADPLERAAAARQIADSWRPRSIAVLISALQMDREPDAAVRRAYLSVLSQQMNPEHVVILRSLTLTEPDRETLYCAWIAWAQIDPAGFLDHFREFETMSDRSATLGLTVARMQAGVAPTGKLLIDMWTTGDELDKRFLVRGIERTVLPQLRTLGLLENDATAAAGVWSTARVAALRALMDQTHLSKLAENGRDTFELRKSVLRDLGRIEGGRRRLVKWLFGDPVRR